VGALAVITDAHCHPFDLVKQCPAAEEEMRGVLCAASAWNGEQFYYHEKLSQVLPMVLCFAVHPQLPAAASGDGKDSSDAGLVLLETLAAENRLDAVGETGFDLFDAAFRETEKEQERLFEAHLSLALRKDLPLVLHVRRAMHKVFARSGELKKCRAVIFHSWPGTRGEGESLLRRGINAFFSFGNAILLNHREAMRCSAAFPAERLLAETDAPYQPLRGKAFSSWADLPGILAAFSSLRGETGDMEGMIEKNFRDAFGFAG
jgi:TatD DNase family protein